MSHADPDIRAMMRAQKALKSALTHLKHVPDEMLTPALVPTIERAKALLDADVKAFL